MEFHQLRYVCAIADTGNFSRAAERCQIAQPSLSQQVLKLEEELGIKPDGTSNNLEGLMKLVLGKP